MIPKALSARASARSTGGSSVLNIAVRGNIVSLDVVVPLATKGTCRLQPAMASVKLGGSMPTNAELEKEVREILSVVNLEEVSLKIIRQKLEDQLQVGFLSASIVSNFSSNASSCPWVTGRGATGRNCSGERQNGARAAIGRAFASLLLPTGTHKHTHLLCVANEQHSRRQFWPFSMSHAPAATFARCTVGIKGGAYSPPLLFFSGN